MAVLTIIPLEPDVHERTSHQSVVSQQGSRAASRTSQHRYHTPPYCCTVATPPCSRASQQSSRPSSRPARSILATALCYYTVWCSRPSSTGEFRVVSELLPAARDIHSAILQSSEHKPVLDCTGCTGLHWTDVQPGQCTCYQCQAARQPSKQLSLNPATLAMDLNSNLVLPGICFCFTGTHKTWVCFALYSSLRIHQSDQFALGRPAVCASVDKKVVDSDLV